MGKQSKVGEVLETLSTMGMNRVLRSKVTELSEDEVAPQRSVQEATLHALGGPALIVHTTEEIPNSNGSLVWSHLDLDPKPHIPYLDSD